MILLRDLWWIPHQRSILLQKAHYFKKEVSMPSSGRAAGSYCTARPHRRKTKRASSTNQKSNQDIAGWGQQSPKNSEQLFDILFLGKCVAKDGTVDDIDNHNGVVTINGKPFTPLAKRGDPPSNFDEVASCIDQIVNDNKVSVDDRLERLQRLQGFCDMMKWMWAYDYIKAAKNWIQEHRADLEEMMKQ